MKDKINKMNVIKERKKLTKEKITDLLGKYLLLFSSDAAPSKVCLV